MILIKKMKKTTNFKAVNDEDVIKKAYLDEKIKKKDGHLFLLEKNYNEFKLEQTSCRRYFNSKSCENDDTNTLW